jgi:putative phosphoesterase
MRIALISDIHGNLVALEAALADIAQQGVDKIVCLGDVALEGPQPVEVIHRLRDLSIPVVKGNNDDWLVNPLPKKAKDEEGRRKIEMGMWTLERMSAADRALLEGYAMTLSFDLDGLSLLCYHGSPRSCKHKIRPLTPARLLVKHFRGHKENLFAGGHTHEAMVRRFGESIILNPGSVGASVIESKTGSKDLYYPAWAEYALVESDGRNLSINLRRIAYSFDDLAAAVRASGMPHAGYLLDGWKEASEL